MAEVAKIEMLPSGEYEMTLTISVHPDPGAWGILMADMLRHLANAYHAHQHAPKEKVVERILKVFRAELEDPSGNVDPGKTEPSKPRKRNRPS